MNATKLRADLYSVLDQVIQSGKPVTIERKGHRLILCVDEGEKSTKTKRFAWPTPRPQWVNGDVDDIAAIDWSKEWRP